MTLSENIADIGGVKQSHRVSGVLHCLMDSAKCDKSYIYEKETNVKIVNPIFLHFKGNFF